MEDANEAGLPFVQVLKNELRYEVDLRIKASNIVWLHRHFLHGRYTDIKKFHYFLSDCLDKGKRVECDNIYWEEASE